MKKRTLQIDTLVLALMLAYNCSAQVQRVAVYSDSMLGGHAKLVQRAIDERSRYQVVLYDVQGGHAVFEHSIAKRLEELGAEAIPPHEITVISFGTNGAVRVSAGTASVTDLEQQSRVLIEAVVSRGSRCVVWLQSLEAVAEPNLSDALDRYAVAATEFYRFVDQLAVEPQMLGEISYMVRVADWGKAVAGKNQYMADFLHPSVAGAELMADLLLEQIDQCVP